MSEPDPQAAQEAAELAEINRKPLARRLGYYTRKSGPGWLQAAITLGGGSLASSLFLGVVLEYNVMWLQPLAMILGVVMLSAIGYVAMSSGRRPFGAVNEHVSPVLGWAWLIAAMLANLVWCLPQFALGTGAIQQNLFPSLEKSDAATWGAGLALFVLAAIVVRAYDRDSRGVKLFELILKAMVGIVVISFFLVVGKMTLAGALDWGAILRGFVPNPAYLFKPAPAIAEAVAATGDHAAAWTEYILGTQKSKIIAGFGTAVGINMTFLLPYSMLRKGWGKEHRGLAIFDLSTGLIIPFMLATGCIVIAAGSQFHGKTDDILDASGAVIAGKEGGFNAVADTLVKKIHAADLKALAPEAAPAKIAEFRGRLSAEDRRVAAMLVDRKDRDLAKALAALAGEGTGRIVFGVGVLGMALSTIIILMLINGFCVCEALGRPGDRTAHFLGSLMPGLIGMCFPLIWTAQSRAALAVPTSVIGGSLLPIAYFTFLLLMNSKSLLGDAMPRGARRVRWNGLMIVATAAATFGSIWALKDQALGSLPLGKIGIGGLAALFVLGLLGFLAKEKNSDPEAEKPIPFIPKNKNNKQSMKFGIIGAGMIANFHAKAIEAMADGELHSIYGRRLEAVEPIAKEFGCKAHADLDAFLADPDLEIVTIATPSGAHLEPAMAAAKAGKHVVCEKPLEITPERIDMMIAACEEAGVTLSGIFNRRFHPAMDAFKSAVDAGRFGKLTMCDAYIKWWRTQEYYDSGAWRGTWNLDGGGALMNQSIHLIDQLIYLAGDVASVSASMACVAHEGIEVEDIAVAVLEFKNGARGVIEGSTACWSSTGHPAEVHLCGTEGSVFLADELFRVWDFAEPKPEDDEIRKTLMQGAEAKGLGANDPKAINFTGHLRNFEDVVGAIKEGREPRVNGQEARRAVALICAIYESAKNGGKRVEL